MKIISAVVLSAVALVAAQKAEDYFPECSISCLQDSVSAASDCSFTDAWCVCVQATYEAITGHATPCVMTQCGADKAIVEVLPAAIPYCSAASAAHSAATASPSSPSDSQNTDAPKADTTDAPASAASAVDATSSGAAPTGSSEADNKDSAAAGLAVPAILGMLAIGAVAAF